MNKYKLPKEYEWVRAETGPRIFVEAVKLLGVEETPGPANNPTIMQWAKSAGLDKAYTADIIPWCALFSTYVTLQAGFDPPSMPLWALNWKDFGQPAPDGIPMLGDWLVKERKGGGHITMYAGESDRYYYCLGGNQNDMVTIRTYPKSDFKYFRRCKWRINQPAQVRRVYLTAKGTLANKED